MNSSVRDRLTNRHLLALRIALLEGRIEASTHQAAEYVFPVRLVDSGSEAAAHGKRVSTSPARKPVT
ncbi:DUF6283 family protein [Streptomyces sp. NPDC021212]|uniref:DUF6283 family protein n=1 Tax=Streptomyces sp. NPDC021212 TaxID=3365118 RepID=UPI0037B620D9